MSTDVGVLNIVFDRDFLVMSFTAILAFATIMTVGLPLLERQSPGDRMRSVAERREESRLKHHAMFKTRTSPRSEPAGFMKQTLESFHVSTLLESPNTPAKL